MKKILSAAFSLALLVIAITLLCTGCGSSADSDGPLSVDTLPEVTTEAIEKGTLYVRCSEPEDNRFSIQFVGVVPTNYIDYVGFEACVVYPDGTRGTRQTVKLTTLYRSIENEDGETIITSENFGVKDGYLFARALDRIPTDEEDLTYEIAAYYVIENEKFYTAKQIFSIQALLKEHILANPKPFEVEDTSDIIEIQKWVRFTATQKSDNPAVSNTYYLGASLPSDSGRLKMYACFAVPSVHNNAVGIRYNFTQQTGENAGVSTSLRRFRANKLYKSVITETETLTIKDFGLEEGYLAVIPFEDYVNYVTCQGQLFNLELYFSRNAVETKIVDESLEFTAVSEQCVLTREGVAISDYTYIPTGYHEWNFFGKDYGNAKGDGKLRIRMTDATNVDGDYKFSLQIATAIPTRFSSRVAFVYTAYDKNGNVIGKANREIVANAVYVSIFDNDQKTMTPADFGVERGYIISMALNNIDYDGETESIKLEAYYMKDGAKQFVASQTVDFDTLRDMITVIQ